MLPWIVHPSLRCEGGISSRIQKVQERGVTEEYFLNPLIFGIFGQERNFDSAAVAPVRHPGGSN